MFKADYQFWIVIILNIAGFIITCFILYYKAYSTEKGRNLATKQDIGEITQIVESIKTSLLIKTEELKSDLSYKNEHLIHLRASERAAIISYYKATWVLVLSFMRTDLIKYEIDNFDENVDKKNISFLSLRYISESELTLNKVKEELSNLKYLKDIAESELMFFYDKPELSAIISELNLALLELERTLFGSINFLLQIFAEATVKVNNRNIDKAFIVEMKRKRSDIFANWYEDRRKSFLLIRNFNENLKNSLLKRLTSLTF